MDGHLLAQDPHKMYLLRSEAGEVLSYGATIPGTGNVWDDLNATDFTGHQYAGVDGCVATALSIKTNSIVTFGHNAISYIWEGPRGVCVGVGGTYSAIAGDLVPLGTGDHAILTNRDIADAHPMAAITGLLADQTRQDSALAAHEGAPDPHPQYLLETDAEAIYQKKFPAMVLGGTTNSFTLNTTDSKLLNYSLSGQWNWPDDDDIDPLNGEISIPQDGIYRFTLQVLGDQGNDTKEEWIELKFDVTGGPNPGRTRADILEVATDKTTGRSLKSTFTRGAVVGETVSLWMWASAGLGTFSVEATTFEVIKIAEIGELVTP